MFSTSQQRLACLGEDEAIGQLDNIQCNRADKILVRKGYMAILWAGNACEGAS